MFSFLKKTTPEEKTILVCLVTSYAVTGAVVKVYRKSGAVAAPVVMHIHESLVNLPRDIKNYSLIDEVESAFRKAVIGCKKHYPKYDAIHCCVGEPWITSMTRTAHLEKRDAFIVNKKLIDDLVIRETKLFEQEMSKEGIEVADKGLLETSQSRVDINGYRVTDDVYNQSEKNAPRAQSVDVHITYTIAQTSIIDVAMNVFADAFHRTDIIFQSFDQAKSILLEGYAEGTICEIGGVSLPCQVIRHETPTHFASIPVGLQVFEQSLMRQFDSSRLKIDSIFKFVGDNNFLAHEHDVYHRRIIRAFEQYREPLLMNILHMKKYIQGFNDPVICIGSPQWIAYLRELIQKEFGVTVIIPPQDLFNDRIIVTHKVETMNIPIALAIMHATAYGE